MTEKASLRAAVLPNAHATFFQKLSTEKNLFNYNCCSKSRDELNVSRCSYVHLPQIFKKTWCDRGRLVVKVSDRGWLVMSPVPLKTNREGERCALNLSRAQTSSLWSGVLVRRRYGPAPFDPQIGGCGSLL
ncbi:hypothetical protein TNCV_1155241 [Trichonephila clavipes]|nr:hypothetical protein TNCV_1155241 [Trichonephila clavipes]